MRVSFEWPELTHPLSDTLTTFELASILEAENKICEIFWESIKDSLVERVMLQAERGGINIQTLESWLQQQWRDYGRKGNFGYSDAAVERGDPPFIHTSTYMLSMIPKITFDEAESQSLNAFKENFSDF